MSNIENKYIGNKIGKITIVKFLGTIKKNKGDYHNFWLGRCECGREIFLRKNEIEKQKRKTCKLCSKPTKTHGLTNTRLFNIWQSMKSRCYNPNNQDYKNYGGRGINMCSQWKDSFLNFYNWAMKNNYNENLSIDRIDVNGDYNPNNCKWSTNMEQSYNKRNTIYIEHNGIKYTLHDLEKITGYSKGILQYRYYAKWDFERIIKTKPTVGRNQYTTNN